MPSSRSSSVACAIVVLLAGCSGRRQSSTEGFTARARSDAVFLNQELKIYFSEPVDPLSITPDTVRVVDGEGHAVASLRREVGRAEVRVHPRVPVEPSLDDGSFLPGQTYWLEVAGYPQINAVRSRGGRILSRSLRVAVPVVAKDGAPYARPLQSVAVGNEPFALDVKRPIEVVAGSGVLSLHFTLPPFPPSVRPQAFVVQRLAETLQRIEVTSASVVRDVPGHATATTVQLRVSADPPISSGDYLALVLADGADVLVDYIGRPVSSAFGLDKGPWQVFVRAGAGHQIARVMAADVPVLDSVDLATPSFEVRDRCRFVPCVRAAAGSGVHGILRPPQSWRMGPSEALALTRGRVVRADATLELSAIDIPEGVRLTIGGFTEPVRILVSGSMRIAGELVLETPRDPFRFEDPLVQIRDETLDGLAGCVFVVGGDIEITGRVEHAHEKATMMGPALALVAGGRLNVAGRVPPGTICACEGDFTRRQASQIRPVRLRSGYSGLHPAIARAYTPWLQVPTWLQAPVVAKAVGADPGIQVFWQTAPAYSIDPSRPDPSHDTWSTLRPAAEPLVGCAGLFVRFLLQAPLVPGDSKVAGIDGVTLVEQ